MQQTARKRRRSHGSKAGILLPAFTIAGLLVVPASVFAHKSAGAHGRQHAQAGSMVQLPGDFGYPDLREPPRVLAGISMDQAIEMAERRYNARVVRANATEMNGRRVYVLRLLSEEGRVWTIRVDAETGGVI